MRIATIVSYDIADPKRLARVARTCSDFGERLQKSVFECLLTDTDRIVLEHRLKKIIDEDQDQVLFVELGPARGDATLRRIRSLGKTYEPAERVVIIA